MKHCHIAFVGMGSIGKRHLGSVCELIKSQGDTYTIDLYRSSMKRELPAEVTALVSKQFLCSDDVTEDYDMVFITNPTSMHLETALKFRDHTKAFFIEKPVFNTFDVEDSVIVKLDEIPSYVACPLRYNPVLQYIKQNVDVGKVVSVRAMSSSYLPDWRPGQDYRETYSAHTDLGGGVDIDLIHEWDYLTWIFGMPTACSGVAGKYSNLEIDSNDTALYVAKNDHMSFELHLDYFGRKIQRTLDIFTHDDTVQCDIAGGTVTYMKEGKTLRFNSERNAFQMAEIKHFFDIAEGRIANDSNVEHGVKVLKLTKSKI
ncbi:Gfo/Idh/MocA family protein [Bacteroides cellulosilyticus]|jgi:predicted dehydrogenase|uniref:Gfo/Idh/MocA family protein n=1 Tax=Bacteroides cellulosilyticus TaxID=246787 RepID=UPI00189FC184|nr:Gfo/Idh/MocA family oxidoreductase [Bacteroides cellulosilyticus]